MPNSPHKTRSSPVYFSSSSLSFSFRLGGESRLGWRGSSRKDLLFLRVSGRPGPRTLRPVPAGLHGGDPGGAAVRGPVEAFPWYWHGDDNHQGGKVHTHTHTHGHARRMSVKWFFFLFLRKSRSIWETFIFYAPRFSHSHTNCLSVCLSLSHTHAHTHTPLRCVGRVIMCCTCRPICVRAFMSRQVIPDVGEPAELLLMNLSATRSRTVRTTEQVGEVTPRILQEGTFNPRRLLRFMSPLLEKRNKNGLNEAFELSTL